MRHGINVSDVQGFQLRPLALLDKQCLGDKGCWWFRNPASTSWGWYFIPLFWGLYTSRVVQDFFHQQYGHSLWCSHSVLIFVVVSFGQQQRFNSKSGRLSQMQSSTLPDTWSPHRMLKLIIIPFGFAKKNRAQSISTIISSPKFLLGQLLVVVHSWEPKVPPAKLPPPKKYGLIKGNQWFINCPLIRPYLLGGGSFGGVP